MDQLKISAEARAAIDEMYHPPEWVTGNVNSDDAVFLYEMILREKPDRIAEVGTASGVSTSVLLHAMAEMRRREGKSVDCMNVFAFDLMKQCYFDEKKRVGEAVREMVPELAENALLCLGEGAARVRRYFRKGALSFAFIDGDHRHPHATLDLIAILPVLAPRAWVAFHDIHLPDITDNPDWKVYGPQHVINHWSGEKMTAPPGQGNSLPNMGAVRVPEDPEACRPELIEMLQLPWEENVNDAYLRGIGVEPREVEGHAVKG